jgi:hypothetical protein
MVLANNTDSLAAGIEWLDQRIIGSPEYPSSSVAGTTAVFVIVRSLFVFSCVARM